MFSPSSLTDLRNAGFDQVIDVRSPSEFAEDHVPGAINLPVLDDAERARVGTLYKQVSPFDARKTGAALVFRNAATHIETALARHEGGWKPLVYCWRGGQRSGAFAWILREIGWPAETIAGGYKTYRRLVVKALYEEDLGVRLVRLGGYTGTAKTEILGRLSALGVQVIDLEAMARHRGSLLGGLEMPQPTQKGFETGLITALDQLDPSKPVIVEAESSKIGAITLPPALWSAMKSAPVIEISAPLEARARYLAQAYESVLRDGPALRDKLSPLSVHRSRDLMQLWSDLIDRDDRVALCRSLAADHYDPSYEKSAGVFRELIAARFDTPDLTPDAQDALAVRIAGWLQTATI